LYSKEKGDKNVNERWKRKRRLLTQLRGQLLVSVTFGFFSLLIFAYVYFLLVSLIWQRFFMLSACLATEKKKKKNAKKGQRQLASVVRGGQTPTPSVPHSAGSYGPSRRHWPLAMSHEPSSMLGERDKPTTTTSRRSVCA